LEAEPDDGDARLFEPDQSLGADIYGLVQGKGPVGTAPVKVGELRVAEDERRVDPDRVGP